MPLELAQLFRLREWCPLPKEPFREALLGLFGTQFENGFTDFRMKQSEAQDLPHSTGRKSGGLSDLNRLNMGVGGLFSLPVQSRLKEVFSLQNLESQGLWFSPKDLLVELEGMHDCDTLNPVVRNDTEN